jgi:hypothetical protein
VQRGGAVPGAEARPGGAVSRAESSVRRKGKELTGGPGASAGEVEWRVSELGLSAGGPSWRARGEEKEESGPQGEGAG